MQWISYAVVKIPCKAITEYIDYAESEGYDLYREAERDGIAVLHFEKYTGIEATGADIDGGEPDEILFEADDPDEDPYEWADVLDTMGAEVIDAWFDLSSF